MREILWGRYARVFAPGEVVLDVGCGTGIDALFLARRGIRVVAIDRSPAMIARARARLASDPSGSLVELRTLDIEGLESLPGRGFDGIISSFASLSSIADLERFSVVAAQRLPPRGTMLLHLLNRWSLWEWLGHVRHRRWQAARRLGDVQERMFVIGGHAVPHYLYHPREAYARFFAERFRLRRAEGLGILRPPHTIRRLSPNLVEALDRVERPLRRRRPFIDWGRFSFLELERR